MLIIAPELTAIYTVASGLELVRGISVAIVTLSLLLEACFAIKILKVVN